MSTDDNDMSYLTPNNTFGSSEEDDVKYLPSSSAAVAAANNAGNQEHDDNISTLTDDNNTIVSTSSTVMSTIRDTFKQTGKILIGKNPNEESIDSIDENEIIQNMNIDTSSPSVEQRQQEEQEQQQKQRDISPLRRASSRRLSMEQIDFLKDDKKEMTVSRRIALSLMNKKWYYPRDEDQEEKPLNPSVMKNELQEQQEGNDKKNVTTEPSSPTSTDSVMNMLSDRLRLSDAGKPDLQKAWVYFEHVTLPRYLCKPQQDDDEDKSKSKGCCKGNQSLDRAEPGESFIPTKLYSPLFTPLSQMGDFGLGIGLYFSTLRNLVIIALLAGCISIGSMAYFLSAEYDGDLGQQGISPILYGSAICTNEVWRVCTDCTIDQWNNNKRRFATINITSDTGNGIFMQEEITLALQNDCEGVAYQNAFCNYGAIFFVILCLIVMTQVQERQIVTFDEDEQTAQDYSIEISNPPTDAFDPQEWKNFFESGHFGDDIHVTTCTVGLDNDLLVESLVQRREILRGLECMLPPKTNMDVRNLARIAAEEERSRTFFQRCLSLVIPGIPELVGRLTVLTQKVQGLSQLNYPTTHVYLSFETEAAQRAILSALSVGKMQAKSNRTSVIKNPNHLFRGNKVLAVSEPNEPSTIRWRDLNVKFKSKMKQLATTFLTSLAIIVICAFIVFLLNGVNATVQGMSFELGAIAIAIGNSVFPEIAKILTSFEAHASEGSKQTSLYTKIVVFRWVNTAIIFLIIKPFTATLENSTGANGLISPVAQLFIAEIIITNILQYSDFMGHIKRHFLAPRAATQDAMNILMRGTDWELAERYTNMTKILFLTLWYCSIFPAAFFFCAAALFVNYFADRFSLMRTWRRAPRLGTMIAEFSSLFFSLAIAMAWFSTSYFWASFPYDNLCENTGETVPTQYAKTYNFTDAGGHGNNTNVIIEEGDFTFRYCLQDIIRLKGQPNFPFIARFQPEGGEWMTEEQEIITTIFGWTCVGVMGCVFLGYVFIGYSRCKNQFASDYDPVGEDQKINFSEVEAINTYVPQVDSNMFSYPLLACNFDGIDTALLDWTDPDKPHSYYDLTKDCAELLEGMPVSACHVFSQIQHWPPNFDSDGNVVPE